MEELLTPVSRRYKASSAPQEDFFTLSKLAEPEPPRPPTEAKFSASSPAEALEALKSQPSHEKLISILRYLRKGVEGKHDFDVRRPSPQSAQLVHVLVSEIVPNHWAVLHEDSSAAGKADVDSILISLRSVTGINSVLIYMKALLKELHSGPKASGNGHVTSNLKSILTLLLELLEPETTLNDLWDSISPSQSPTQMRLLKQELISLLANSKITSLAGEADYFIRQADSDLGDSWLISGKQYIDWLLKNVLNCLKGARDGEGEKLCTDLLSRAMKLPRSDTIPKTLFDDLFLEDSEGSGLFMKIMESLPLSDQKKWLDMIIKHLASQHLNSIDDSETTADYPIIWAAVSALSTIIGTSNARRNHILGWLTNAVGAGIGDGCGIRRAVVGALADDKELLSTAMETCTSQFGDKLFIKHAPILQQEAYAQVLLLAAGYVHKLAPIKVTLLLRSSAYLNAISNRIGASQTRARVLGMVVGEALSGMVHNNKTKLNFKIDEVETEDAQWYKALVSICDRPGPLDPLRNSRESRAFPKPQQPTRSTKRMKKETPPKPKAPSSGFIIEEVEDDDEEEEDPDLVPYAKPDSDAEDSDEDPTLINRNKPKTPVYIRDLITYFRNTESYDHQKIALETAPTLIRRKANYGTEVLSHAEELATLLVGVENKYDLDDFENLRLQGMVAIVLAQPKKMAPWFGKTFFDGDYSLSQRASVLVVLGLSGRELAGFEVSEYAASAAFPSKQLPARIEKHYLLPMVKQVERGTGSNLKALPPNAIDNLAQSLSQTFLAPLAAEAADATTGPDALKLSSFTSRLKQAQSDGSLAGSTTAIKKKAGIKSIPNTTAAIIASAFFFPLTSRFQAVMHSSSAPIRGVLLQSHLLTVFLKTLALLLHAAGPSTLSLPQMTAELWDILLGVRGQCLGALDVTQSVLFGLIALLDVNQNNMRGLCDTHGREIVETTEWVSGVFDNTRGGDEAGGGEENQVKMMAAGVLIRLKEAIENHQALLVGDLIGYSR